ncbi:cellulase family glycosylhydrolase [Pedobacter sp. HMF7647]|uniref:Cellulase family glycosylhydrolase n=1 Tax=Hufsiella arboris TaxID=2695275 RepID=A0A7K1Y6E9_9SPHI|nr:cellulase family glycosylhydrolase [Hufsiella arboris]MXV50154.1 cellulase family glycosylhydrolase [Hufsiella arboris]
MRLLNRTKFKLISAAALCTALYTSDIKAQGFLKTDGQKIVNEKGQNVLFRGIGLGGWMLQEGYMLGINKDGQQYKIRQRIEDLIGKKQTEEFYAGWLANHTRKADVDSLKKWGFNSIRLPMHYNLYTLPVEQEPEAGKNTWLDKGFTMTDSLLAWCKANKMYLILDLHAAPGGQGTDLNIADRDPSKPSLWDSEANKQKTIALWRKLAERYANESWIGAYDIINEPNWGFEDPKGDEHGTKEQKNEPLQKLMVDITKAIREVDKKHIVIIEGNGWGNNYNGITPTWDNNLVMSFHKYWNFNDQASIVHIVDFRNKYNIPAWLGETGENSNVWFTQAIQLFEKNNIGWSWWPLKKLGNSNPEQIRSNLNYQQVVDYWNDPSKGKPTESNAYSGLFELLSYLKVENAIIHHDVIDAMIRQPFTGETRPFKANKLVSKLTINAVDYDLGRNGSAYFDQDTADYHVSTNKRGAGNRNRVYRNDGVDIQKEDGKYESYFVTSVEDGEWLQFTVNAVTSGTYKVNVLASADRSSASFSAVINGKKLAAINVPVTADNTGWQTASAGNATLNKGLNKIRIYAKKGGFNIKSIELSKSK